MTAWLVLAALAVLPISGATWAVAGVISERRTRRAELAALRTPRPAPSPRHSKHRHARRPGWGTP